MRLLVAAAVVLPLLVFAIASAMSYGRQFDDARDRLSRTLDIAHEHAVKVFETLDLVRSQVDQAVSGLSDDEIRRQESSIHLRLKSLSDTLDQISGIYIFDALGVPLASARVFPVPPIPNAGDREYFRVHRDGTSPDRVHVSDRLIGRVDGRTNFFIVSSQRSDGLQPGVFGGVIAIAVEPDYFRDFYAKIPAQGLNTFAVDKANGAILARFPEIDGPLTIPATSGFMIAKNEKPEQGSFDAVSAVDGVSRLYAYRRIPGLPVYVVFGVDRATVLAAWRSGLASHLVYGIPATLGLVLLSLIALRRTRQEAFAVERVRQEVARREQTEEQLRQSQKMEAVGRLTGGLAHDFNNLLTIVVGSLDLASRRLPDGEARLGRLIGNALDGANRAARLTHRLLAFARQQPLDPKPTDVNRAVGDMADLIRQTLGETIRVETVLGEGLWRTRLDRNALESSILNLAVNARDAMEGAGGRLTIETANTRLDDAHASRHDVTPGQYVQVALSDTGEGMPKSVIERAFEPFFTTKEPGKGTGLGLSQVYGFAKQSGGHVDIVSEEGRGTTVRLYLPRYLGSETDEAPEAEPAPERTDGQPLILVVEDEDGVRNFAVEALRDLGYRVLQASGGAGALETVAGEPDISLMLTDVVMPDLDGRQVADAALKLRPDLKIIFMSGYTGEAITRDGVLAPGIELITKPFTQAQLAARIRLALNGNAGV